MRVSVRRLMAALVLGSLFVGCGGGTPAPTPEEQSPEFGNDAANQMQQMQGIPTPEGMKPAPVTK